MDVVGGVGWVFTLMHTYFKKGRPRDMGRGGGWVDQNLFM